MSSVMVYGAPQTRRETDKSTGNNTTAKGPLRETFLTSLHERSASSATASLHHR
ncbi:hypothetical protein HETIRDRAFT_163816 [Heterobasidion irregulare TC 32-1]|uniref:Uncharacterized protein n=1 Tax=Heterobasidion irregulare (strain TC 32-1) TaxID=747525 RepID=W4JWC3_HETIT|nr:uncharacterized protein HETIRDRAFT_163816 [Heterobasidion irregulare TC 32-1]ETW77837.1 hypothetical protein HETIRDRAFT_163816 [Heterobasidion irregulare TC 32-1]